MCPELGADSAGRVDADEARQRLAAEPLLADFFVVRHLSAGGARRRTRRSSRSVTRCSTWRRTRSRPATDIPVPAEYVVGPGDTFEVQLIGNNKGRYTLVVRRDGRINFPELGPDCGQRHALRRCARDARARVSEQMIGTQASVSIGELRSIRVFVLGDAKTPGSYTVSGLSTITNALFVSGGVKKIGSLRNIELKRNGQTVTTLDLYDLLLAATPAPTCASCSGDVIFVPPIGTVVGLGGRSAPASDL